MLKPLVKFLIDPFTIFWVLLAALLIAAVMKKQGVFKWLFTIALLWFLIISTPLIPTLLLHSLEKRYTPIDVSKITDKDAHVSILVLGGGHGFDDRLPANALLSPQALGRLSEAIRLYRQLPNSRLIFSGFSASGRTTQAEMLQNAAEVLGVQKESTSLQEEPANTHQEILTYGQSFPRKNTVILVTSAYHMPRAVLLAQQYELNFIASPANFRLKGSRTHQWVGTPSTQNIENLDLALSEYASLAWYKLKF